MENNLFVLVIIIDIIAILSNIVLAFYIIFDSFGFFDKAEITSDTPFEIMIWFADENDDFT